MQKIGDTGLAVQPESEGGHQRASRETGADVRVAHGHMTITAHPRNEATGCGLHFARTATQGRRGLLVRWRCVARERTESSADERVRESEREHAAECARTE
jgi:hypothetical protein